MIEKCLDSSGEGGMLLTDLLKAFDCLIHNLLIAKLAAYGFGKPTFHRTQNTELDPFLFNTDIFDFFLRNYKCDIASYADVNTPYSSDTSLNLVLENLEKLESSTQHLFR